MRASGAGRFIVKPSCWRGHKLGAPGRAAPPVTRGLVARDGRQRDAIPDVAAVAAPSPLPRRPETGSVARQLLRSGDRLFQVALVAVREARDLRKGLFGPKGLRNVPKGEGVLTLDLPNGWTLRLTYDVPPDGWSEPSDVVAEFIPPTGALSCRMIGTDKLSTDRFKATGTAVIARA